MVNYNEGKIYKIESTLGNMVYYGSTTKKRLCDRMTKHRGDYKLWLKGKTHLVMSYKLFDEYGLENCKIILVENYPCESKDELAARERHYITNFDCVNKYVPNRTKKEWYTDNKDKILEQRKEYYTDNKNKILEQMKEYYENNRNKRLEQMKEYYENNKNKLSEQRKIKYTCPCGSCICKDTKAQHERSKKHIKFLESQ